MFILFGKKRLILGLTLFCFHGITAEEVKIENEIPSTYVSREVWMAVQEYLMPDDHPIRKKLDQIFSSTRALSDAKSMKIAGFDRAKPQPHTGIIVTRHPELPGYVIKAYRDDCELFDGRPEYHFWIKRARGARKIQAFITAHKYDHYFKVPKKWIYLLPDEPSPPSKYLRKNFILVAEDMDIYGDKKTKQLWGSDRVTKDLLDAFYNITTELGLADCAKPANCPFSRDGRIAFVDTQISNNRGYVKYDRLTPYLSSPMRDYWKKLTK